MKKADFLSEADLIRIRQAQARINSLSADESQDESAATLDKMTYAQKIMAKVKDLQRPLSKELFSTLSSLCEQYKVEMPANPINADLYDLGEYAKDVERCKMCQGKLTDGNCYKSEIEMRNGHIHAVSIKCELPVTWRIIRRSKMPYIYMGKMFESDFDVSRVSQSMLEGCSQCIKGFKGVYLYGAPKAGKTFAACCIINHRAANQRKSLFFNVTELMFTLTNFQDKTDRADALFRVKNCPLLVLDDIGSEYPSDYTGSVLYDIIDYRYTRDLPMAVTSNFSLDELGRAIYGAYGERITRRLKEVCTPFLMK